MWGHIRKIKSRVHFLVKACHLPGDVKGSLRFPKMVVGTLGKVWLHE